jgi:hypothetical protein
MKVQGLACAPVHKSAKSGGKSAQTAEGNGLAIFALCRESSAGEAMGGKMGSSEGCDRKAQERLA